MMKWSFSFAVVVISVVFIGVVFNVVVFVVVVVFVLFVFDVVVFVAECDVSISKLLGFETFPFFRIFGFGIKKNLV